ncbi:spondin domain-containing protein [Kitasatospora atroaurantiaca]|uniref:Uncharacterized protein n=1 Tax=Kitasatospora atroaurantiaca TaxID=285545 RepID=A0A561F0K8_9ACTN|nr:spondin domain-containing protein [Kitasatospora atroaurantiaca]TWE21399.1 hypothetical protein FB465_6582 [Kitasatospora atroaurantiaca]
MRPSRKLVAVAGLASLLAVTAQATASASAPDELHTYQVTLENLTHGQPFSPPVAATTRHGGPHMFQVGRLASRELEEIAEDGNEVPMFDLFGGASGVTDAVDVGRPLTPQGTSKGAFDDRVTFTIKAHRGDRLSLATMLICTNDGFLGLDHVRLPLKGHPSEFQLKGYDAGTERNTERTEDIVDPCSALGPVQLAGDPNGNIDDAVDETPHQQIRLHPGIQGNGDLCPELHGWENPVAKVTVEEIDG